VRAGTPRPPGESPGTDQLEVTTCEYMVYQVNAKFMHNCWGAVMHEQLCMKFVTPTLSRVWGS